MLEYSKIIKELVETSGKSKTQISKELGLGRNQIYYWIIGRNEPSITDMIKLAKYFEVSIDYLVGYNQEML